eukprot:986476-Pyramimonas_sp.AAC.2
MAFIIGTPSRSSYGSYNKMVGSIGQSPVCSPHMFNQYLQSMEASALAGAKYSSPGSRRSISDRESALDPSFVKRKSKMDQLHHATEAGQNLRRTLCAGSNIVVINAGYKGKRFIYEKARDMGVQIIIVDNVGSWYGLSKVPYRTLLCTRNEAQQNDAREQSPNVQNYYVIVSCNLDIEWK